MKIIDGKKIAEKLKSEIANEVAAMIDKDERGPHLAAILVGDDAASQTYVASKEKACASVGMTSSIYRHPSTITEKELLKIVDFLNSDDEVDGFIVQLPLPAHIDENKIIQRIDPKKDVDGFHPINIGKMVLGLPAHISATPQGIMMLLEQSKIETSGKHVVVVGRSNIVGTPLSILLSRKAKNANATVTLCHSKTENLKEICKSADILIAAIGVCEFIKADMVKDGAVVIDVGMHRIASHKTQSGFKLKGDVAFNEVAEKCGYITPVPGGVGPMTIVSLLQNTLKAYKKEVR
ncbi:MAG: bifunctional methylenetetrahydrofolate dehydrogenase/methenyltetrahydrofolate cyclohydrolase FolD [Bacteroidetes bacterium HGW-Bacteroidetes-17]|jgi:methylenetetrahydrofolate dehydrogenase (NADP+)/methenyltetrahydrofolate cyclohydrolase|nr:MAG: bifunctional methylenetetrahydrofolate dehydrogenase/methenyltetrahydrofolate cyclohydrolase FolD [Bacteroidetes bacterium HGW-Bacteroidetes-17]